MAVVPKGTGVFWIGQDGNVYVKGNKGTNAAGRADGNTRKYWGDRGFAMIDDPNPVMPGQDTATIQQAAQTAPVGGGGGGGGSAPAPKPDRSNSIALNLAGLGSLDSAFNSGNASIDKQYSDVVGQYDAETTAARSRFDTSNTTNNQNYQKNYQTGLVNAAQGRQGLFGSLASIGALNGDGIVLANRAVAKGANDDLAGAADSRDTNASMLTEKWQDFELEDKRRREDAARGRDAAKAVNQGNTAKTRQEYYTKLSNDYAEMGDGGSAKRYADMAGGLFGEIALANTPNAGISRQTAAFTPSTLADYMAGQESTVVEAAPAQPGEATPGLIANTSKRKKETQLV
jgi:hypothetical protein